MGVQWEDLERVDQWVIYLGCFLYVLIVWVPEGISLYLAFTRPNDKRSEKEFDQKWYKWKKQYMWHELWFRTHFIAVWCLIVVFIGERMTAWISIMATIFVILDTAALKYVSRIVENRVPSAEEKAALYRQVAGTLRSHSDMDTKLLDQINSSTHKKTEIEMQEKDED